MMPTRPIIQVAIEKKDSVLALASFQKTKSGKCVARKEDDLLGSTAGSQLTVCRRRRCGGRNKVRDGPFRHGPQFP